jgi:hypothetical protein
MLLLKLWHIYHLERRWFRKFPPLRWFRSFRSFLKLRWFR